MRVFLIAFLAAVLASCASDSKSCTDAYSRSQGEGQPCCEEYAGAACGAGLFCAAFDGRTQAVCYAEYSRAPGEQCSDAQQCANGSCNQQAGRCRFAPKAECDAAVGCTSDAQNNRYACDVLATPPMCRLVGLSDASGTICAAPEDCASKACEASRCKLPLGGACHESADCVSGACAVCSDYGVTCQNYYDGRECLLDCGSRLFRARCD